MPTSIATLILKRFFTKLWNHLKKLLVLKKKQIRRINRDEQGGYIIIVQIY